MSDVWADHLLTAKFGGLELTVVTASDSIDRALVRHAIPRRDGGRIVDMGSQPRETRCMVVFAEEEQHLEDHIVRFKRFIEKANEGERSEFVHPITGSYRAFAAGVRTDVRAEERNLITVDCTFVEDALDDLFDFDSGLFSALSSIPDVGISVELLNAAFEAATINSSIGFDALDMVTGWNTNPLLTVRQVGAELESFSNRIANLETSLELGAELSLYPVLKLLNLLSKNVRRAADFFRDKKPALIEIEVAAPVPLLTFCADIYGAQLAAERAEDATRINRIEDPTLLPAGQRLTMPAPNVREQQRAQGASA